MTITLFDTTLRDGAQTEGISFTVEDKLKILRLLDDFGVHYIEGGWPGSNPKDIEFFKKAQKVKLKNSKLTAFGSTRRAKLKVADDPSIKAILESKVKVAAIFGKCWDFHVKEALKISLDKNLEIIEDTLAYLKSKKLEVIFDAEHFFDGYKANPEYAVKCLRAAEKGGAKYLVLCDTNGGTIPNEIGEIIREIKPKIRVPLGIHAHNDSGCGVANSIIAVESGAVHVQGTINGYGERCGNADLTSIIPNLQLKMNKKWVSSASLKKLTELSHHIAEIANFSQAANHPFVGRSAFSHKGGIHVSAVLKNSETYEHIKPELVGNERRVTVSELSGISNLIYKAKDYGVDIKKDTPETKELIRILKNLEHQGYQFEEGEASFELLVKKTIKRAKPHFELVDYQIQNTKSGSEPTFVEARIKLKVKGQIVESTGEGDGPVNALDDALRGILEKHFPEIEQVKLTDYKVRVLDSQAGTAAKVRVIIESADEQGSWGTVGVSTNVIEASWQALVDSMEYKLIKE